MAQCVRIRKNGEQCRRRAVTGYTVCQVHGAGSPLKGRPGMVPKVYKQGGRYSKFLPTRLAARFAESENDPDLLVLRKEIALVDTRISDVLSRVDIGEAGTIWLDTKKAFDDLTESLQQKNARKTQDAIVTLSDLIKRGNTDYAAWNEVIGLVEQRRKLVESEQKRIVAGQHMLRMEEVQRLMGALTAAVREYVNDPVILGKINHEFIRLSEIGSNAGVSADNAEGA